MSFLRLASLCFVWPLLDKDCVYIHRVDGVEGGMMIKLITSITFVLLNIFVENDDL